MVKRRPGPRLTPAMVDEVAARFKALGEPLRLRIVQAIEGGEMTVGEIADELGASQSNVSRHLKVLYDAGIASRRPQGGSVFYLIADPTILEICALVCGRAEEDARTRLAALQRKER
jgi:DNA-binding transcriptional ArsR family regulator